MMSAPNWALVIAQSMDATSYETFLDEVESGRVDVTDVPRIARAAEAEAGGRPWWEVERLAGALYEENGRLLGELTLSGVNPEEMTLAVFLSAVWARLLKGSDTMQAMKLESQLTVPPADVDLSEMPSTEESTSDIVNRLRNMPGISVG